MKTSKKILLVLVSLLIMSVVSGAVALGVSTLWQFSFWKIFFSTIGIQLIIPSIFENLYDKWVIQKLLQSYNEKPYKSYMVDVSCQHCGHVSPIEIDLNDTEFVCSNCKKPNAVHVTFITAAVSNPINNPL